MVYAREVAGRVLTFQVSGQLWRVKHVMSLLMRDVETGSLWSHVLGEAKSGPLTGKSLEIIPAVMTTWADWKRLHPDSSILAMSRTVRGFKADFYKDPARFALGVVHHGEARAYGFDRLRKRPLIQEELAGDPVLVVFNPATTFAAMYERRADDRVLHFKARLSRGKLVDRETDSRWDPWTGAAVAGTLKGTQLRALPAIPTFTHVWRLFHPESSFYGEKRARRAPSTGPDARRG